MYVGYVLARSGEPATPAEIAAAARAAEQLGFDSLWTVEQEIFPTKSPEMQAPHTGQVPAHDGPITCVLDALTIAAEATQRTRLGVTLPNIPFYSPVMVSQSLAALDQVSNGRVQIGLGLGYTLDEFRMVESALTRPDSPTAEFVQVLRTIWEQGVAVSGEYYAVLAAPLAVRPVQRELPPINLAALTPPAVQRSADLLRGGAKERRPLANHVESPDLFQIADASRRSLPGNPVVVRAAVEIMPRPLGPDRPLFSGSEAQIRRDIIAVHELGAREIVFDLGCQTGPIGRLPIQERLARVMEIVPAFLRERTADLAAPYAAS